VKKLITSLTIPVLVSACRSTPPTPAPVRPAPSVISSNQTGGPDAVTVVRGFMAAAKQQDLQAMGALWGDASGPARDAIGRDELEKRELIMLGCLKNDRYDIIRESPSPGGGRAVIVYLKLADISRSTTFQVVRGPANRWYVQKFDLEVLQPICARRG
jgi:hypothetical protein